MSWNPLSWFTAAKTEFEAIEQKAEEIVISLESEALQAVEWLENTLHAGLDELTDLQSRLENDIADKTEALQAVKDAIAKASTVAGTVSIVLGTGGAGGASNPAQPTPAPAEPQP